jgi:protein-disulfide isomerase
MVIRSLTEVVMGSKPKDRAASRAVADARRGTGGARWILGAGVAIIVALVVAIGAAVYSASRDQAPLTGGPLVVPARATETGAVLIGRDGAGTVLDVYADYLCPYCGRFETANSADLSGLVTSGKVLLKLHPMAFLDEQSAGTHYSTRAANAAVTVADKAPEQFLAFNAALFEHQPAEGKPGLTDEQIAGFARQAGVPQQVVDTFTARTYVTWIQKATQAAFDSGVTGTPTVKINDVRVTANLYTPGSLAQAVADSGAGR